jgi:hypothetical protein
MPQATLSVSAGDMPDSVSGAIGDGINLLVTVPVRLSRLEIGSTLGYQTLRSYDSSESRKTLFTERNMQMTATWHFSSRLNLRLTHRQTTFDAQPPFARLVAAMHAQTELSSALLTYQTNWQPRIFLGVVRTSDYVDRREPLADRTRQVFAKISYAFSN